MQLRHYSQIFILLLIAVFTMGCSAIQSSRDFVEGVNFERNGSNIATPRGVYIHRTAEGMDLHGELKRNRVRRGPIAGHLHVVLFDPQGNFLMAADVDYKRHNVQADHAHFSIPLPLVLETGSTVEITHIGFERDGLSDHPVWADKHEH